MAENNQQESQSAFLTYFILFPMKVITQSLEVFLRKQIGERYFTMLDLFISSMFLILLIFFTSSSIAMFDTTLFILFIVGFMTVGIIHIIQSFKRHGRNKEIHSYYAGTPIVSFFLPVSESTARLYVEPFLLLAIGIPMMMAGKSSYYPLYGMGFYISLGAVLLIIKSQIEYAIHRSKYLDALDKKIESEALTDALEGKKSASDNKGFSIPGPKSKSPEIRKGIEDMYRSLDGNLQQLMENSKGNEPSVGSRQEPSRHHEPPKDHER